LKNQSLEELLKTEFDVTEKWFNVFRDEFTKWVHYYGIKGWEFHFIHADVEDARASVSTDQESRLALVTLSTKWSGMEPNDFEIRKCAFHEATELFLAKINFIARSRYTTDSEIEEEIHNIIRILENVWWIIDYEEERNETKTIPKRKIGKQRKTATNKPASKFK
jgi:hypothetical protein